jgi:DNA-binding CsgD family transcriptional regulator
LAIVDEFDPIFLTEIVGHIYEAALDTEHWDEFLRLTEAIINGLPLAEAAEQLGIRLSTARTRLKTIQTKTHCHRQVDLVQLALSLPAVRQE